MALIDADGIRERFDIEDVESFPDKRIEPHIATASRRLRSWVGSTLYEAALNAAAETPDPEPTDDELAMLPLLANAEAHLTMYYAILGFNSPLSSKGVVATAMADEGKEMRKYLSPDETMKLATFYFEMAESMAREYIAAVDAGAAIVVLASDTSCEGATRTATGEC